MSEVKNNVMMTEEDNKIVDAVKLKKQIAKEKKKQDFVNEVDKLLKKYNLPKDYLYLAAQRSSMNTDRKLYMMEVETFVDEEYDGNITLMVHGTSDEAEKYTKTFEETVKNEYKDYETMTLGDVYFTELGLPIMLVSDAD